MAKVKIQGHASGTGVLTVTAPNTSTDRTITLPDATGTLAITTDDDDKLPLAGGALTGNVTSDSKLTIGSAIVQGAKSGIYVGNPTGIGVVADSALHIANGTGTDAVMQITFGLQADTHTKASGYIGLVNTGVSSLTKGDLVFGTRNVETDTTPSERLRITTDGRGLSQFTAKFWINFNGTGTIAARDSHNISSIADNDVGRYSVNIDVDMANVNYAVATSVYDGNALPQRGTHSAMVANRAVDDFEVYTGYGSTTSSNGAAADPTMISVIGFGD